jgi:hypothetical protein
MKHQNVHRKLYLEQRTAKRGSWVIPSLGCSTKSVAHGKVDSTADFRRISLSSDQQTQEIRLEIRTVSLNPPLGP